MNAKVQILTFILGSLGAFTDSVGAETPAAENDLARLQGRWAARAAHGVKFA